MNKPVLVENFTAGAAVSPYRIVMPGAADGFVLQATAVTDALFGVSDNLGAASGRRLDVITAGLAAVVYGGTVARGDWLTSDATGRAIAAAPSAGVNNNVIGQARNAGVVGDIGSVQIAPGRIQG